MTFWRSTTAGVACLLACLHWRSTLEAGSGDGALWRPAAFLQAAGGLTSPELLAVDRGGIVAKTIETSDRSEVLSVAVMRVTTTPARVLERETTPAG